MTRLIAASALALCAQSASAQTILDTLNAFKANVSSLNHRPQPAQVNAAMASMPSAVRTGSIVSVEALANDTAPTHLANQPIIKGRVDTFAVAGIKLGMSPREVADAAQTLGVVVVGGGITNKDDFETAATRVANERLAQPLPINRKTSFGAGVGYAPDRSYLHVDALQEPSGSRVWSVSYITGLNGSTPEQALAAAVARYGSYSQNDAGTYIWCGPNKHWTFADDKLSLSFSDDKAHFVLEKSTNFFNVNSNSVKVRAQQIAASRGGGVKF